MNFETSLIKEANVFLELLFKDIESAGLNLDNNMLDHICYRAVTSESYLELKKEFLQIGTLLIESMVGGRLISTFKLYEPLVYKDRKIDVIELPSPKASKIVSKGYEHAEFVITEDFLSFSKLYPKLKFNFKGANKAFNPELQLSLHNVNIKFHHISLEEVILIEKQSL